MENFINAKSSSEILARELGNRIDANPSYSQRAFARDIGISPGRLSEIINGHQGLSRTSGEKICAHLGYNPTETDLFCDYVDMDSARDLRKKQRARKRVQRWQKSNTDPLVRNKSLSLVSEWQNLAVLEFLRIEPTANARRIATSICIDYNQAKTSLEKLKSLGLIEEDDGKVTVQNSSTSSEEPSNFIRSFHTQILDKAKRALIEQSMEERNFRSAVVAIDAKRKDEFKQRLTDLFNEFCDEADQHKDPNQIYAVSMNLFKISNSQLGVKDED